MLFLVDSRRVNSGIRCFVVYRGEYMKHIKIIGIIVALLCNAFLVEVQSANSKIPEELIQQLIKDINTNKTGFRLSSEDLAILRRNLKYELHDLNRDLRAEFFLYIDHSDWCGAGGNCSYWVYQKTSNGYKLLLADKVLKVMDTVTNGYRDLESQSSVGFCDVNVQRVWTTFYKYNGNSYQFTICGDKCIRLRK
jgi:hypothetical protein